MDIIGSILVIWGMTIISALATMLINYFKTVTKDARLQLALEFAEQVVLTTSMFNIPNSTKKIKAEDMLSQRLEQNGMSKFFTTEQIDLLIESSVKRMKDFDFERNADKSITLNIEEVNEISDFDKFADMLDEFNYDESLSESHKQD